MKPGIPSEYYDVPAEKAVDAWMKLAAARREALVARADRDFSEDEAPPLGFAVRVAALAVARQRDSVLSRWTRWALRGALASAVAAVLVAAWPGPEKGSPPLLRPPVFEVPHLASL